MPKNDTEVEKVRRVSLYKYVHEDRVDVLETELIRFSQPAIFNDPFELRPALSKVLSGRGAERVFEQLAQEEPDMQRLRGPILSEVEELSSRHVATMQDYATRGFNESLGILSLTKRPDSLLMWAHYANGHQGFVIDFDEHHRWFHQGHEGFVELGRLRKVRYRKRRPYASMDQLDEVDLLLTKHPMEVRARDEACHAPEQVHSTPHGSAIRHLPVHAAVRMRDRDYPRLQGQQSD